MKTADRAGERRALPREILRRASLFAGLDDAHLDQLLSRGGTRRFVAGQTLFRQGEPARGLYVVLRGRVKVFKTSPKGREQTLMLMGPGEPVGEVAVLSGEAYPATAEGFEEGEAFYIPRQAFLDLVTKEPEVAMRLLAALSARLRSFAALIEDLSLREVAERLAAHLLALATEGGETQTVELEISRTELSAAVGTVPETLSRAFRQLAKDGVVETRGRQVVIKDRVLLERAAGLR
jgi:CRP/FNR family transcriptional regulator